MAQTADQLLQKTIGGLVIQIHQLQAQVAAAAESLASQDAEIQGLKVRNAELEEKLQWSSARNAELEAKGKE